MIVRRLAVALLTLGTIPAPGAAPLEVEGYAGDPLRVRNLSPLTRLYGLPRPLGDLPSATAELSLTVEHSNNFSAVADDGLTVVFDGSTTVTSLALRGRAAERWEWGVEVPLVHHGGGFTDGFIEGFHDVFGFPNANREAVPHDRLEYRIEDADGTLVNVDEPRRHLGDVAAWIGYRVHHGPQRQVVARSMLELPSGRIDDLSGSETTDVSAWMELVDRRSLAALDSILTVAGGVTVPGSGALLAGRQADAVGFAHLGVHYPLTRRLTLRAQLDGHTDVIDTAARVARGALMGTLGGSVGLSRSLRLDLAVVEDLSPHDAPDVVFLITLDARL